MLQRSRQNGRGPFLFGLAPCGVCPARRITAAAVRSYRTFSPLPHPERRGGMFSVALSVENFPFLRKSAQEWATPSRTLSGTLLCGVRTFLPAHSVQASESMLRSLSRMDGATVRSGCLRHHYMRSLLYTIIAAKLAADRNSIRRTAPSTRRWIVFSRPSDTCPYRKRAFPEVAGSSFHKIRWYIPILPSGQPRPSVDARRCHSPAT